MKTLEYEGKAVFARYHLPIPLGKVITKISEAEKAAEELGGKVMVKAQVHTGGRGKAGGIKKAFSPLDAAQKTKEILGMDIKGYRVKKVYIEEMVDIAAEYYLGLTYNRSAGLPVLIISSAGGVDIETAARETPKKVTKMNVDPLWGLHPYQIRREALGAGIIPEHMGQVVSAVMKLYNVFLGEDARLAEINPAIITTEGNLVCGDSKLELDDSAAYRHRAFFDSLEPDTEDPVELRAREEGISFVKLQGNVAIIGNGAGLVMGTLDSVSQEGGSPANFLDIGGGALAEKIEASMDIALDNPKVKSLLVNIFGGITRCDEAARGIITAMNHLHPQVPIVIRLGGTNEDQGQKILKESGIQVDICRTMQEATVKAVKYAEEA